MRKRPLEAAARAGQEASRHRADAIRREIRDLERRLRGAPPLMEKALNGHIERKRNELARLEHAAR